MYSFQWTLFMNRWLFSVAIFILLGFGIHFSSEKVDADDIVGVWQPQDETYHVELYQVDGYYHGKIVWMENPNDKIGRPKLDKLNPQRSLRTQEVLGLEIVTDFEFNDLDNIWEEGMIYNPSSGETMKGNFKMVDKNTLNLSAFVGFSLSEVTFKWTRVMAEAKGEDK